MAEALEWVSRITSVGIVMVAPGLAGDWLDKRLGTGFLSLLGFGVGIAAGVTFLIWMTNSSSRLRRRDGKDEERGE